MCVHCGENRVTRKNYTQCQQCQNDPERRRRFTTPLTAWEKFLYGKEQVVE